MRASNKVRPLVLAAVLCAGLATAAAQTPGAAAAHLKRGDALYVKGDLAGAAASFDKAIELNPASAYAHVRRGHVRRAQGALDRAIEDYERAAALDPSAVKNNRQVAQAYTNRGLIRKSRFEPESAIADYDRAIQISPDELQSYLERGQARALLEDFDGALADFTRVVATKDDGSGRKSLAHADRGFVRLLLGREDEARKDFDEAARLAGKERIMLDYHLKSFEVELQVMRELRARRRRGIG